MRSPMLATSVANEAAALPPEGEHSRLGVVTRAAGEGPRAAGIDGQCESAHEADSGCNDSRRTSKEAEVRRRSVLNPNARGFADALPQRGSIRALGRTGG